MRNHPFFTGQEVAVKQAEVKAVSKAKADVLAKAWSQTQALKEGDPVVCAPLWGSYGAGVGPARRRHPDETPFGYWRTEAGAEAGGVWPEAEVEVGAWKEEELETSIKTEADHEMRIIQDRVTLSFTCSSEMKTID